MYFIHKFIDHLIHITFIYTTQSLVQRTSRGTCSLWWLRLNLLRTVVLDIYYCFISSSVPLLPSSGSTGWLMLIVQSHVLTVVTTPERRLFRELSMRPSPSGDEHNLPTYLMETCVNLCDMEYGVCMAFDCSRYPSGFGMCFPNSVLLVTFFCASLSSMPE